MATTRAEIDKFLSNHRIALVGVSRNPQDFSRAVFRELTARGYDVVPVNPLTENVEDQPCFPRVQAVDPPVEAALLMTSPSETERVVRDCAEANIREVWMHKGGGQGSVSQQAVAFCHEHDIQVVEGCCPFMFLPNTQWFHRAHGFMLKLMGSFPAAA
jgi:predicted CoA-binding protein